MQRRFLPFVWLLTIPMPAQEPIRVDVKLINLGFAVRDNTGKLVLNLTQDDFEVFEDGAPQKISFFARSTDVPLNLGLLVDMSGSQEPFMKRHHKDLETFLKKSLGPRDKAFLLCFGNRLRVAEDFSSSPQDLAAGLKDFLKGHREYIELGPPHEKRILGTAFYDAIYYSIQETLADAAKDRRALIIFSDGEDNSSAHNMLDAIEAAQNNDVLLFSVRYTDAKDGKWNARNKYGKSVMERISRETGGAALD